MIPFNDFKKLDIKVGRVLDVNVHPKADKLLVLKVKNPQARDTTGTIKA